MIRLSTIHRVIATGKVQCFDKKGRMRTVQSLFVWRGLIWGLVFLHIEYWNFLGIILKDNPCAQSSLGCCMKCRALDWSRFQWAVGLGRLKIHSKHKVCLFTNSYRGNPSELYFWTLTWQIRTTLSATALSTKTVQLSFFIVSCTPQLDQMSSYHLAFLFLAFNFFISPIWGQNSAACNTVSSASDFCAKATPGWSNYDFPKKAPCLCYDDSAVWNPRLFDGLYNSCLNYLKANSATGVSGLPTAPCSTAGDVLASATRIASVGTSRITPAPSAASSASGYGPACQSVLSFESRCEFASPGFSSFSNKQRASCLCYSGVTWNPNSYDNVVDSCIKYLSTADKSLYSSLQADGITSTPCKAIGQLTLNPASTSATMSSRPQTSITSSVPAQTTRTVPTTSSTSSPITTKGSSSSTSTRTPPIMQTSSRNGVGPSIEVCSCSPVPILLQY